MRLKASLFALVLLLGLSKSHYAQVPTNQDCLGAITVCDDTYTVNFNHSGQGNYTNEIFNAGGCYATEANSVWFKFTIQQAGLLRFAIDPLNGNQDHDWTLFDLTNGTCSQLANFGGASGAMARSNTWGVFGLNGPTGVSTPNGGVGNCNGPGGGFGPKWCADLNVAQGEVYYLHVTNWTGSVYGFTLDLSASTAVLFDNTPPQLDTITSQVNCQTFDSMTVEFDEPIVCSNIQAQDFVLEGPGGTHTVTAANGGNCGTTSNEVTVHFTPAVTQVGDYYLKIKQGAGYVEDLCGNLDTLDSIHFYFDGILDAQLNPIHLDCFGECIGEIDIDLIGGAAPYTYSWSGGLPGDSDQVNLCAGPYTVTITDGIGCTVAKTIDINQPADIITSTLSTTKVSCPNTTACDGGAVATANGGTPPYTYAWSSGENSQVATQLCAGINIVTTTDSKGCIDTLEVDIGVPDTLRTTGYGDTMVCINGIASIAASATGGTPPYSYIWTEGSLTGPVVATNQVIQVSPDTTTDYFVQTYDSRGCEGDTSHVLVKVRPKLGLDYIQPDTICPYDTITITVQGTGGDSNYTYAWSTGTFGNNITISPDEPHGYGVTVSDVCGTPVFKDSIFVQVGGYSAIDAEIRLETDSICVGKSIYLIAEGRGGFKGPKEYVFNWAHTNDIKSVQFVKPNQTKTYELTITDLCLSKPGHATATVHVGGPESILVEPSVTEHCGEKEVTLYNMNFDNSTSYNWIVDGEAYNELDVDSINFKFKEDGCHPVSLSAVTAFGCKTTESYPCMVKILEQPVAGFTFDPLQPTSTRPYANIINTSTDYTSLQWIITGDTFINEEEVYYYFSEGDSSQLIKLYVANINGCKDTLIKPLPLLYETLVYYPNSFSPNGDGLNDVFGISGEAISDRDFSLIIYDRWGRQLFRSASPDRTWDGHFVNGELVPMGSYPFELRYRDHLDELRTIRDFITVVKTGNAVNLH